MLFTLVVDPQVLMASVIKLLIESVNKQMYTGLSRLRVNCRLDRRGYVRYACKVENMLINSMMRSSDNLQS